MRIQQLVTAILFAGLTAFAACAQEGEEGAEEAADTLAVEGEDLGDQIQEGMEETGEAIEEGAEAVGEAVEEGAEAVEEAAD